jgi:dTDP-4-amino-4,6-dideoxygalactose transaminase
VTARPEFAQKIALLRNRGQEARYRHSVPEFDCRTDSIQGAVTNGKRDYMEGWTKACRAVAARCDQLPTFSPLARPASPENARSVYHAYSVCQPRHNEAVKLRALVSAFAIP